MAGKIRYHTVSVTEGGAYFGNHETLRSLISSEWNISDAVIRQIITAELGDEIAIDGSTTLYILKGEGK